jgi:hypothetical protein
MLLLLDCLLEKLYQHDAGVHHSFLEQSTITANDNITRSVLTLLVGAHITGTSTITSEGTI